MNGFNYRHDSYNTPTQDERNTLAFALNGLSTQQLLDMLTDVVPNIPSHFAREDWTREIKKIILRRAPPELNPIRFSHTKDKTMVTTKNPNAKSQGPFTVSCTFKGQPFSSQHTYAELRTWTAWAARDERVRDITVKSRTGKDVTTAPDILPLILSDVVPAV